MNLRKEIKQNILKSKIDLIQIDPNGLCNSKCWYCPVKYQGNPKEFINQMPINDVEHIFKNIRSSPAISNRLVEILLNNFNEIFLYKEFYSLINLLEKYNFTTLILTNGTTLNDEQINFILNNKHVIRELWIHIPIFDEESWSEQTTLPKTLFYRLCNTLDTLHGKINATIHLSGVNDKKYKIKDKYINSIITPFSKWEESKKKISVLYPNFKISIDGIIDRAGILADCSAYKNERLMPLNEYEFVNGCNFYCGDTSRIYNWLLINSIGDAFICCNDFYMKHRFGNLLKQSLEDCWYSEQHIDAILNIFKDSCTRCQARQTDYNGPKLRLI